MTGRAATSAGSNGAAGADHPQLADVWEDGTRLLADCPGCEHAGRVTLRASSDLARFDCFNGCGASGIYRLPTVGTPAPGPLRTRTVDLARVRPPRWAWSGRVPFGYLALLIGAEGIGKGTLLAWVVARLTRGELPGDIHGEPVDVLWIGDEDSFDSVVYPRLYAAGVDTPRVRTLADGEALEELATRADELAEAIVAEGFRVVVFDQLLDHLGAGLDDWRAKQVRDALRPLRAVAREHDVAVLAALHPNKGQKATFRDLLSGSHQFNALSRSSLLLAPHPDDADRRVLVRGKGNLCSPPPSFEFSLQSREPAIGEHTFKVPLVADECEGDLEVDELLTSPRPAPVRDALAEEIEATGTGSVQRLSEIARAVGKDPTDKSVRRALEYLADEGLWQKLDEPRGAWRKLGIVTSSDVPIAKRGEPSS